MPAASAETLAPPAVLGSAAPTSAHSYPVVDPFVDSEGGFAFYGDGSFDYDDGYPCFLDTGMTGKVSHGSDPARGHQFPVRALLLHVHRPQLRGRSGETLQDMLPLPITFHVPQQLT